MAVAWQAVRAALVSGLSSVIDGSIVVYDGPVVSGDAPEAYLTVAHSPTSDAALSGEFRQEVGPDGFSATETGTVLAELGAVTGDTEIPSVFETFAVVAGWVQSDMTLGGVLSPGSTCTVAAQVAQAQTTAGAVQRLVLTFSYFTRL